MHLDLATILILHPLSLVVGAGCFLYLRWYSRRSRGLGKMAIGFLVLAAGSVLAGEGIQGHIDYATWTFLSFVSGPVSYALFWLGLLTLVTERPAGRGWWIVVLPVVLSGLALATGFHLDNLYRSSIFLSVMAGFALASAWLVARDPQGERLQSRYGLASALVFKALIAVITIASIVAPAVMGFGAAESFLVLILCQFAIAMFVVILVLERAEKRLIALTETDSLTGIRNRHWMMDRLPRQMPAGSAFLVIDIDHFKRVNDLHGHAAGDLVLKAVAQAMAETLGAQALFARMGGEEFGLLLPKASEIEAIASGELLRQTVEALAITFDGVAIPVTLSAGVAVARGEMSLTRLIGRADEALYVAKRGGRNRVCSFGDGGENMDQGDASGRRAASGDVVSLGVAGA
ncbi:MAG: GGDEF domain-containing protein [Rhizobium sp.]|nr:GGDEF domain-containing protein [Rhizobium sp.]